MKTLYLLRHARAEDSNPHGDGSRNLSARGRQEAGMLSFALQKLRTPAQWILCSPADRTRQTLDILERISILKNGEIFYPEELYGASASFLLETVNALDDTLNCVMIVGHNPGLHELATGLLGTGDAIDSTQLATGLSTCGFASLTFETASWSEIGLSSGKLEMYWTPHP